jgi:hypothetical protein
MRMCRKMGELALDLLEAAAARAQRDLASEPQQPAETAKPARRNVPDAAVFFARLCNIVETAIALEARLAKGLTPAIPKTRPAPAPLPKANAPEHPKLSQQASALASSTSLAAPLTPPWQPKQAAPLPVVTAPSPPHPQPRIEA